VAVKQGFNHIKHNDGTLTWWCNGTLHNLNGPAIIYTDGTQTWMMYGNNVTAEVEAWLEEKGITYPFSPEDRMFFKLRWA